MAKNQENMPPRDTYQTGVTEPPKKWGGLIAALFMTVIFLCGIITGLGAMNIKLFHQIASGEPEKSVSFSRGNSPSVTAVSETQESREEAFWTLGFVGRELSDVYRTYYELPRGVYISQVDSSSLLGRLGLQPGDVLVQVNNTPIICLADAKAALEGLGSGTLVLYRAGQSITITF